MTLASLDPERWVRCYHPQPGARLRLVCFPYAGGSATAYRAWGEALPASIEVGAIQLPGHADRLDESPFSSLKNLVQALAAVLRDDLAIPAAFWGHSLGAALAFEVANRLRQESGWQPACLFLSAHSAPHLPRERPPIHLLPDGQFWRALQRMNGIPDEVSHRPELRQVFLPILRADVCASETYLYLPRPPLACPISVFGGKQDKAASPEALAAWRAHTQAGFKLRMLEGDHFFITPSQAAILSAIVTDLRRYRCIP